MSKEIIRYPINPDVQIALVDILKAIETLQKIPGNRPFSIDGRLVGDIGEVIAAFDYQLQLEDTLRLPYDASFESDYDRKIQIKATFAGSTLGFKKAYAEQNLHYLGLHFHDNGEYEEVFNGPATLIYDSCSKNNVRLEKGELIGLTLSKLRKIEIPTETMRLPRRHLQP